MSRAEFSENALPLFKKIDPTTIESDIGKRLTANRATIANLLAEQRPYTWDNLMQKLEDMGDDLGQYWSPINHLHAVMQTEALREAYNKTLPLLTAYYTEISQNEVLFHAIHSLKAEHSFAALNPAQQKIIDNDIRDFKLSGVDLPHDKKAKLAHLEQALSEKTTRFSENLLDATNAFILAIEEVGLLKGLPEDALALAKAEAEKRKLKGYVFTLEYPSYSTALKYLENRKLRETLYNAYVTRASECGPDQGKWDNTPLMQEILKIRHEIATLVGFSDFAHYSLATKTAKKPEAVLHFLRDLLKRSKPIALQEFASLKTFANNKDGLEDLKAWDVAYYSEKLRGATFNYTQEELRAYFPIHKVLTGLFTIVQRLYGITICEQTNIETWHPDVKFFNLHDKAGNLRGGFYIDLYARAHKKDGAWMDECRSRRKRNGDIQYPVAYLTCNFMPAVQKQSALLTHDDVLTLFHEFGHGLHHMLTKVDYPAVGGINGVPWDAIEFPSQFMENFCWEKETLQLISEHVITHEVLPDALYEKMLKAKHFQTGLQMLRQLEFALFDFKLHLDYDPAHPQSALTVLEAVREETGVIPVPRFNRFPNSFSHIFAGGYAAGYYSYKWAEVLSADAYEQFEENGILDPLTGEKFLTQILEIGGVKDIMEAFTTFRGRGPKIDALLRHNGITDHSKH